MHRNHRPTPRVRALGARLPAFALVAAGLFACDDFDDELDDQLETELREGQPAPEDARAPGAPGDLDAPDGVPGDEAVPAEPAEPGPPAMALASDGEPEGTLDKDIIRRIVRAHINEIRHCYNQLLTSDPEADGRVVVQFKVSPDGDVPVAVVSESTIDDEALQGCMATAVKRWKFPKPRGGGNVLITYPFILSPD